MAAIEVRAPGDGSLRVTINRPDKLNAFTPEMYRALRDAIRRGESDPDVEVIVIGGWPRAFGTGADIEALGRLLADSDPLAVYEFPDSMPFETIRDCEKVVVAAVQGLCLGAGFVIAALCDLVVATHDARFGMPEGRLGFSDPFGPACLFTKLPTAYLKYLLLTGEQMSADDGWRLGFIATVTDPPAFEPAVDALVRAIQQTGGGARRNYKKYVNDLLPRADTKAIFADLRTDEGRAAVTAFAARRRARS
ncbi:enoyl-CoA hydratase/isomerase family protein [Pseudofrankia inefficax]|uniref:Enoyl-CoA hydratase/isomerase n=1 Tax=Pseudofrankia inefficax (strain DSM 45817 / CECT 9037 / DDB 130130 / EuI1c) TaxID=298654 RepID=E3J921_PSEI1|nr:enoyl-CoA hydratase/isomerase family protein [Pseudofrankia inefficax]ADP80900.1 Enoyl-CoA hydratase/isomerase [Pseudofrankia inefficax]